MHEIKRISKNFLVHSKLFSSCAFLLPLSAKILFCSIRSLIFVFCHYRPDFVRIIFMFQEKYGMSKGRGWLRSIMKLKISFCTFFIPFKNFNNFLNDFKHFKYVQFLLLLILFIINLSNSNKICCEISKIIVNMLPSKNEIKSF